MIDTFIGFLLFLGLIAFLLLGASIFLIFVVVCCIFD